MNEKLFFNDFKNKIYRMVLVPRTSFFFIKKTNVALISNLSLSIFL